MLISLLLLLVMLLLLICLVPAVFADNVAAAAAIDSVTVDDYVVAKEITVIETCYFVVDISPILSFVGDKIV